MIFSAQAKESMRHSSVLNQTLKSFSGGDSALMSSREEYWVVKVDQLMSEKRSVMKQIKDKNHEIRKANQENQKLAQALKYK